MIAGAVTSEWLLLLSLFTGACYIVARSPSPALTDCDGCCGGSGSRTSPPCSRHCERDTVTGTALTRAVSDAHKVELSYFNVLVLFYSFTGYLI